MSIENEIKDIEREITAIKTTQQTQNDSYSFYRYKSGNLYFADDTYRDAYIKFIPDKTDGQETIVFFEACNGTGVQYDATPYSPPDDPLSARTTLSFPNPNYGSGLPQWCRFFYIYCISNKQGRLEVEVR